jgi:hypothetical protein
MSAISDIFRHPDPPLLAWDIAARCFQCRAFRLVKKGNKCAEQGVFQVAAEFAEFLLMSPKLLDFPGAPARRGVGFDSVEAVAIAVAVAPHATALDLGGELRKHMQALGDLVSESVPYG